MGVVDFAAYVKEVIQAGEVVEGTVVKVVADNGAEIGDAVFKVVQGGNGAAAEVGVAVAEGAGGATTATGLGFLAIDVGVAGAAIAPALGVLAGVGLYNLAPEFWTNVSNALVNAGQTIGGKVIAYWNGDNVNLSAETIEIFKNALIAEGEFDFTEEWTLPESEQSNLQYPNNYSNVSVYDLPFTIQNIDSPPTIATYLYSVTSGNNVKMGFRFWDDDPTFLPFCISEAPFTINLHYQSGGYTNDTTYQSRAITRNGITYYLWESGGTFTNKWLVSPLPTIVTPIDGIRTHATFWDIAYIIFNGVMQRIGGEDLQPDATYPTDDPFSVTYPDWIPWEYPITIVDPSELPVVYPIQYPEGEPDQQQAQNPDPENVPEIIPQIIDNFQLPDPNPDPQPEPEPEPDPDPQPEPDPIDEPDITPAPPDPADPNPDPTESGDIPIDPFPATASSNRLFTVYNPTAAELDSLGGYLWDGSIIAQIRDIWQEPLDGIISLIQVYATPATSGAHNIILGFLNTGISAPVVSNQFTTIDCGSVRVNENKGNATDYAPFTSLHVYLPFIGIVELDTNECMNATINIKYRVDVYTGTCLATIAITRSEDMPNGPILYNYSGNCAQQIPLTSGNATGMLSTLIGGITAGLSVASGGSLGVVAGASIAGQSLTNDMFHIGHSGNLSANAGILGNKKPYLIIGRRHGYDANNYNALYGFPANKTIYLGNQTGYVKVKSCFLKTSATQPEHDEIMSLLETGVIL